MERPGGTGRVADELRDPPAWSGVYHLAVVTVLGHRAVIGPARVIDSLEGFQELHARRAGDSIELTWTWSPSSPVTLAAVHWDCDGEEQEPGRPSR